MIFSPFFYSRASSFNGVNKDVIGREGRSRYTAPSFFPKRYLGVSNQFSQGQNELISQSDISDKTMSTSIQFSRG